MAISQFGITVTDTMAQVFDAANTQPTDWAVTLAAEGLTTRALARPFVVLWARSEEHTSELQSH